VLASHSSSYVILIHHPGLSVMSSHYHQDGHAVSIQDLESGIAEKKEESDSEHQPSGQTADSSREQRVSEGLADQNEKNALPVDSLDWNGPDDPDNPHNWSTRKAIYHTINPAIFGFAV
jgi:hypothetical protein